MSASPITGKNQNRKIAVTYKPDGAFKEIIVVN
jgi:hypothetical protein